MTYQHDGCGCEECVNKLRAEVARLREEIAAERRASEDLAETLSCNVEKWVRLEAEVERLRKQLRLTTIDCNIALSNEAGWKAEALAARTVVDAAMEILDNWRDLHSGVGDGLTDYEAIRRSNEAREGE